MKKMKWSLFSVLIVLISALAACGTTDGNQEGTTDKNNNVENTRYTGDGMTNDRDHTLVRDSERDQNRNNDGNRNNQMNNNNSKYDVSKEAADRITDEVKDIDRAYVLTTENNAYVAANLDTDGTKRDKENTGNNNGDNMNNNNNGNMNNEGDEVTDDVKQQISKIVKSVDNNIDNVYVSTNPDFLDLTGNYVDQMDNGKPVRGFFDQFGNMVERLFPQDKNR